MPELRNITPDEFELWMSTESRAHGNRLNHDPEHLRPRFDLGRSIAVFEDGQIVGGCHSHLLEMSIPGGTAGGGNPYAGSRAPTRLSRRLTCLGHHFGRGIRRTGSHGQVSH